MGPKEIFKLKSTEIALWYDRYSLQWRRSDKNPEKVVLSLAYNGSTQYKACSDYIEAINRLSEKIIPKGVNRPPTKLNEELANSWPEFVDPQKREKNVSDFLLPIVQRYRQGTGKKNYEIRILDAAAGLGCETNFFETRGYNVTANEIDEKVYGKMPNHGKRVLHTKHDWRVMASKFPADEFDIILLLGNSFCLLHEDSDRRRVLQQFHKILRSNGPAKF